MNNITLNESSNTIVALPNGRLMSEPAVARPRPPLARPVSDELQISAGESAEAILMKLMMKMTSKLDNAIRQQARWVDRLNNHEQEVAKTNSLNEGKKESEKLPEPAKPNPKLDNWTGIGHSASLATFELQQLSKLRETVFSSLTGAIDSYASSAKKMAEKVGQ